MEHVGSITQNEGRLQPSEHLLHPPRPDVLGIITGVGYHHPWRQGREHKALFLSNMCVSQVY